jgi:hypothetical protein
MREWWFGKGARYPAFRELGSDGFPDRMWIDERRGQVPAGLGCKPIPCESNLCSAVNDMEETVDKDRIRVVAQKMSPHIAVKR